MRQRSFVYDGYQVIIDSGDSDPYWDDFVSSLENSHYEQSTCWAKAKQHQGWEAIRIKVLKSSEWLAGAQILCKKLPIGGSVGRISSGPFFNVLYDQPFDVLLRSINETAHELRIQYTAITPYVENESLDRILEKHGYRPTLERLPPVETVRATLLLDLSKEQDALLKDMDPETRRRIKLALKSGLSIREGEKKDLGVFFKLMSQVAERRKEKPVPPSVEFFKFIWDQFYPRGYLKLFMVESGDEPISAAIIFTFGNTVRFWKYGWSGEEKTKHPNRLLYWELIKWSKNNGFRYFDIVQVDPYVADHLSLGLPVTDELKSRRLYGPTHFKMGFGGRILRFSGPWFRFQNPTVRYLYGCFGRVLTGIPYAKNFISRIA
jgi:lipid II:glycine glycyltransferase (peptidoglycan interpeptide bridge formation enzyme)